jgi:hypothetical protein
VLLQPYPNRSTTFQFELANLSDDRKNLLVEMIALPSPTALDIRRGDAGWPPGRILDERGAVAPLLAQWADEGMKDAVTVATAEIALPPDEQPRLLEFKAPGAAPPAPEEKTEEPPAAPPPEPETTPAIDASYGLACRVVNKERPQEQWTTWLEIVPLRPTSYVDLNAEVAGREIRVTANPADADGDGQPDLPPGIADKPISLVARGDNTIFEAGSVVPVNLGPASQAGLLTVQPLESVTGRPTFSLEIDGYPRAVSWQVDFENQTANEVRNPATLRFERIAMQASEPTRSRLYRIAPHLDHPPIDPKQWPIVENADEREPICAFDISAGARPLEIRLRADAARDAFNTVGGGNAIVLAWQDNVQGPTHLYDNRAVRSQVTEVTKAGELRIESTVNDFHLSLEAPGVNNKALWLTASMSVQGAPDLADSVMVVFDGRPPQIAAALDQTSIREGTPSIGVTLDVEDLSGVAAVEAWFAEKPHRAESELDPKKAESLAIPDAGPYRANEVERRRIALQAKAPEKAGTHWLTLRVTDRSGQQSTTLGTPLSLAVEKPPPPVVGPVIADLRGWVMLGKKPGQNLTVAVEGTNLKAKTGDNGQFVIRKLKAEKYKLVVSGWAGSREVVGDHEVTLAEKADYDGKVVIVAMFKPLEPPKK